MRLRQIKLAGFKSFAEPTVLDVPGQLVGVVGPNGCGKSNIIDAVRWVLGESRASELRGESMQDVIFSGASNRKPAGRASVELVFDNALGRLAGPWAQYAEISVRRVLTRDGQSTYQINQQTVRRRDVHDLFLGTGLGPRAYAIIGQGMISRIIEARPEELRTFLEEAAGVSRYRERRRETESRLSDTRENLTRVEDIVRELEQRTAHLEQQAEQAQRFRTLDAERERRQRFLWLVRRDEALAERERLAADAASLQLRIDERLAALRELEAGLESLRAAHYAAGDEVHVAQGRYYEANAEVARLESEIRFVSESQGQLRERIAALDEQVARAQADRQTALETLARLEGEAEEALAIGEELGARVIGLGDEQPALEVRVRDTRAAVDEIRARVAQTRSAIELSATRQRAAQEALDTAMRRRDRLGAEAGQLVEPDPAALEDARVAVAAAEEAEQASLAAQAQAEAQWREADAGRGPAQVALREAEQRLARLEARIAALRQLQERLESQGRVKPWLERHGLARLPRLWQKLRIADGWETAVEAVLRERVSALEIGALDRAAGLAEDAPPAKVAFFAADAASAPVPSVPGLQPLATQVQVSDAGLHALVAEALAGLHVAQSLAAAVAARASLPPGHAFVLREGHLVGRHTVSLYAADSEQEGVLARQHELDNLARDARAQQMIVDDARTQAAALESRTADGLARFNAARDEHTWLARSLGELRLAAQRLEQQREQARVARERIDADIEDVAAHLATLQAQIEAESSTFEALDLELAERQQLAEDGAIAYEAAERDLAQWRERLRQTERDAAEASFRARSIADRIETLRAQAEQAASLIEQAAGERQSLEERLAQLTDEAARHGLEQAVAARLAAEQALSQARARLDELGVALRQRDEERLRVEREQEPLRARLVDAQLREQAARLNAEQYETQLAEAQADVAELARLLREEFAEPPRPAWLQGEVTRLSNQIAALGAVNLAALDELGQARERQGFLAAQSKDLNEAIATLEDAIRRIDRESRELLQQTYDTVNQHFGRLFPEIFGGGEARLVLSGEEILDAGLQVMAQPPGKRNTSIHLLSGGEKAMTAIALVFAIFQLNPAPFCLLDEVDAPLDDSNTERYCEMVRRMTAQTQFLFISHNKIAMEMAQQLVGVTMQEQGVSRLVAVDLESAARLAEAA